MGNKEETITIVKKNIVINWQGDLEYNVINLSKPPFIPNPNKERFCLSVGILYVLL
jgi:hypothetical protein